MKTTKREETMKRCIAALLVLGMLPWTGLDAHQTEATTFRVTARVEESCEVTSPDIELSSRAPQDSAPLPATIELSATCTLNTTYYVNLSKGRFPGTTISQRNTVSGAQAPNHRLRSDVARTAIPVNTTGTERLTGVGTGLEVDHTLFGGVLATHVVPAGDHAETITVRVHY